jgi:arylsulfatase A-like enzyme
MHGDSPEFYKAVEMMDAQMGRLWAAIQYREKNFKEDWVIYITTDHGRSADNGKNHGGQSDRERNTWIVTNAKGLNNYFKTGNPGIVDIMPSIASFLNITIPREYLMEIDGIPLTGNISATSANAILENGKIKVTWKAVSKKGNAKIWLATTNHFKEGGKDEYSLEATVPLSRQEAIINVSNKPSSFYKIVIEAPGNMLGRWVVGK